jgi:hypothetical protein
LDRRRWAWRFIIGGKSQHWSSIFDVDLLINDHGQQSYAILVNVFNGGMGEDQQPSSIAFIRGWAVE